MRIGRGQIKPILWFSSDLDRVVARQELVAVYSGTRLSAMVRQQWMPNIHGRVEPDAGIFYRKAQGAHLQDTGDDPSPASAFLYY
jgi:hypothetical protein